MIGHEEGYKEKEQKKDLIWLLNTTKEISPGLDKLGNGRATHYNAPKLFVLMWMGEIESEDSYVKRVHLSIETLILSGGNGAVCCRKTIIAEYKENTAEKEVDDEVYKLAAIRIIE